MAVTHAPQFLELAGQTLFVMVWEPPQGAERWVLHLPAFGEEMNKSRHLVAQQAREWAAAGVGVLSLDFSGTGDSEGELTTASWAQWQQEALAAVAWLSDNKHATSVALWGLRLGGLMALDLAHHHSVALPTLTQVLLWQPVLLGKQFITQFFRLRLAADMMAVDGGTKTTMATLRDELSQMGATEVAGYRIGAGLADHIESLDAKVLVPPAGLPIDWFEMISTDDKPLAPASQRTIDQWADSGAVIRTHLIKGDAFWATQELAWADALIEATCEALPQTAASGDMNPASDPSPSHESAGSVRATVFSCGDDELVGVVHPAEATTGVLIVVGGPQYRVGSHRQFLQLSHHLASAGIPSMRFDYRGMGDASGPFRGFEQVADDIRCAVDAFLASAPHVTQVVIWGLCDAASAAAFYAPSDDRVSGLVLLNPWVRSEAGEAKAQLKHYYWQRLRQGALWKKIATGQFDIKQSLRSLWGNVLKVLQRGPATEAATAESDSHLPLAQRLESALTRFRGQTLLIISGNDLTAAEFTDEVKSSPSFKALMDGSHAIVQRRIEEADHTFSRHTWKQQVEEFTRDWMQRRIQ